MGSGQDYGSWRDFAAVQRQQNPRCVFHGGTDAAHGAWRLQCKSEASLFEDSSVCLRVPSVFALVKFVSYGAK